MFLYSLPYRLVSSLALCISTYTSAQAQVKTAPSVKPTLTADAEVHIVGVSGASGPHFYLEEFEDWASFGAKLKEAAQKKLAGPALRIWDRLSPPSQRIIEDPNTASWLTKTPPDFVNDDAVLKDRRNITKEFRRIIEDPEFYSPEIFAGYQIGEEATALFKKGKTRSKLDTMLLNRLALRAAFPKEMRPRPIDPTAVEINVVGDRPVVLVVCSSTGCNWIIQPAKGTIVVWVIVSAANHQEIKGVDCPVTTLGVRYAKTEQYNKVNNTFEKDSPRYPLLEKEITTLTGLKVSSFQGIAHPDKPFTVRSGEKKAEK